MAEVDNRSQLLSRRATLLAALGRAEVFAVEYNALRDESQVPLRLEYLNGIWNNLETVQAELEDNETNEDGKVEHAAVRADFEPRLFKIKACLISKLSPLPNDRSPQPSRVSSTLSGIKLPTISLPEFDGDYMQWLAFHDTFLALIHSNSEVPDIQKFHYLRAAVKGEAAQLIESIGISSANYSLAWQTLESRYSNDYLLKKRHLQALLDIPRMKKESAAALHGLVDEFERHTRILRQLGEPTDAWSTILEHLLCTRLHDDSLKAWEDHASTVDNPDYTCLIDFLQRRTRVLESISVNHQTADSHSASGPPAHSSKRTFHSQLRLSSCASTASSPVTHVGEKCVLCNQSHLLMRCQRFNRLSPSERQQFVKSKRLCHNCMKGDHIARNCPSNFNCRKCSRRHHTLLHSEQPDGSSRFNNEGTYTAPATTASTSSQPSGSSAAQPSTQSTVAATESIPQTEVSATVQQYRENVFLLTVIVKVIDAYGEEHLARALLDSASQPNLITDRMAHILRLRRQNVNVTVQGAGKLSKPVRESVFAHVFSRKGDFSCSVDFLVMDKVTANLPSQTISTKEWHIPKDLFLADPSFNESQPIDMVLGAKHFYSFFPSAARLQLGRNLPLLVDSVFGWIVAGSTNQNSPIQVTSPTSMVVSMISLEDSLERFWKTEELTTKDNYSVEERHCESLYQSTVSRDPTGRYIVRYPRKPDFNVMLGESKSTAQRRFGLLERRLERDPNLKDEYHLFMREYLSLGHMRLVEADDEHHSQAYYLPHHPVIKEASTTTKVRVVFDGSAKTSTGFSLNEALCVGPVVQDDLLTIILRFRTFPIALVGDIAKMYRQVLVHPNDSPLQRILWRFSDQSPVQTYELLTVTYGLGPSAYLATRTLQQLAEDEGRTFTAAGPALKKGFYVDDFIGGAQTVEEAIQLRIELGELLEKGGFALRKWTSNRLEVLQGLTDDQIGMQSALHFCPNETIKALGISWEPEADFLRFDSQIRHSDEHPTKRTILSDIARLFDPLGLIAPVVVRAKILMQELWLLSCGWDDPVPEPIKSKWESYHRELAKISEHRVDRYALLPGSSIQLHTFADASQSAYGACTYARCEDGRGTVRIQLLASKSRVAPLKRISIARLELCAAVLAAHLHTHIKKAIDVNIIASYFWSDSAVTLQWLRSPPNVWPTFVANRVSEIQQYTHGCQWKHVPGGENPADLVSRGMSVEDFLESYLWTNGPSWLTRSLQNWPNSIPPGVPQEVLEIKTTVVVAQVTPTVHPWFLRWSSYNRLLRIIAYCMKFVTNTRAKVRTQPPPTPIDRSLTVDELTKSKTLLIRLAQHDDFAAEIKQLEEGNSVSKRSPLHLMSPFIDPERVLRVGGRLNLSQLPYQEKHPALIPTSHPLTRLIVEHFHRKLFHGGGRLLLTTIREEFWPPRGRKLVRSVVRNCFRCTRLNPVPAQQQIGQLPAPRVIPSRPFSVTGVDYAGPLYLRPIHKRTAPAKAYLCLFVCFATKAVHLELVSDLSTQGFLCSLRRFIARRGRPAHIHSDNGKNFEGAKNELSALFTMLQNRSQQEEISSACTAEGITWHLIPPKAPHFGGLWEAAVKVAKKHLFRQLGSSRLSFEEMCTILTQIEAIMNSRPLLPMTEDPNDLAALTPAHFLIGSSMHALPDPDLRNIPANRLDHYQKLQMHVQQFWIHWRKEYLQELQKDTRRWIRNDEIIPGKLVIIVDDLQPPIRWPLARIESVLPGKDQLTRVVSLRTDRGIITRPITKICLLPCTTTAPEAEGCLTMANNLQPAQRSPDTPLE
ncbi:uncharacterized protein LOC131687527 [Topomyia yanbarensis]|uniref:uncharacterized protein LOC131687527 n=1 Tax=Topomyia yanbarensis TaxID=2498891 RepID=UPI00273BA908|nr:uncharacterized protein LOC131687527 [Topomyia yanbarensis]